MSASSVRSGTKSKDQSHLLHNPLGCEKGGPAENLTDSLTDRVERLLHPSKPLEWGHPLVSTTPTSVAIDDLTVGLRRSKTPCGKSHSKFRSSPTRSKPKATQTWM